MFEGRASVANAAPETLSQRQDYKTNRPSALCGGPL